MFSLKHFHYFLHTTEKQKQSISQKERKKKGKKERGDSNLYRKSLACCGMLQTKTVAQGIVTRLTAYSRASEILPGTHNKIKLYCSASQAAGTSDSAVVGISWRNTRSEPTAFSF